ncbi:hypothetical protein DXG01_013211 [Tephrocybe rancida]|nr:hypothetical protein DXG01_013211 [Tephrocybe rancida]
MVSEPPHVNLHKWLNPKSLQYNPTLAAAVFHYSARTERNERLEICIATQEMMKAAWKYSNRLQILLDGTFGLCDRRLLLFIVMAIDEERHGIPLAFLFFSAPAGNLQSSAGYDTEILTHLLSKWKASLEDFNEGKPFYALVAITDTNLKERAALLTIFPDINKMLKGKAPVLLDIKARLWLLEEALISTVSLEAAKTIIADETQVLQTLTDNVSAAEKGLLHLNYLTSYWLSFDLWASWLDFGRHLAARILGCKFDGVLPTTNHLELFNSLLKRKHLHRWQRRGHRLRLDVLIKAVVIDILPAIFEQHRMQRQERGSIREWILSLPGGQRLWEERSNAQIILPPVAYLVNDPVRDASASAILYHRQISVPVLEEDGLQFTCYSSHATPHDRNPVQYTICIRYSGSASCSCLDFIKHGGACKHLRAALMRANELRQRYQIPSMPLPSSEQEARNIYTCTTLAAATPTSASTASPTMLAAIRIQDMFDEGGIGYLSDEDPGEVSDCSNGDAESVATDADDDFNFVSTVCRPFKYT